MRAATTAAAAPLAQRRAAPENLRNKPALPHVLTDMRTLLLVLTLSAVALCATPAQAARLHLVRLAHSPALPVADGRSGGLAYLLGETVLRVRRTGQPARAYAVPAGCRPTAMAAGVIALDCRPARPPVRETGPGHGVAVLRESDGAILSLPLIAEHHIDHVAAIGARWLVAYGADPGDDVRVSRTFLVAWTTGRVIELESYLGPGVDPFRLDEYADLDAAEPRRRLCRPVTRGDRTSVVVRIGRWVAFDRDTGGKLQRCGSDRILRSDKWSPTLGRDAFAYQVGGRIVYRDLRSDRRLTAPRPSDSYPLLRMFGRRLVVVEQIGPYGGPYRIYLGPDGF